MWIENVLSFIEGQWDVLESGWAAFLVCTVAVVIISFRLAAYIYRERLDTSKAHVGLLNARIEGLKSEIAGLKEDARRMGPTAVGRAVPPDLTPVVYGGDAAKELYEQLLRDSVVLEFNPTESREWKFRVWNLSPDKFARFAAARRMIEEGLAKVEPNPSGGYRLTGTSTASGLRPEYEKWQGIDVKSR